MRECEESLAIDLRDLSRDQIRDRLLKALYIEALAAQNAALSLAVARVDLADRKSGLDERRIVVLEKKAGDPDEGSQEQTPEERQRRIRELFCIA